MVLGFLTNFGASVPEVHIAPQTVFHLGPVAITNSILYGWISAVIMVAVFIIAARRITVHPKGGFIQFVEVVADYMSETVKDAFENKERSYKYILYFVTIFFFMLANNLLGIIPGVGESVTSHGNSLLRPFTADFNATLAMAVVTMLLVYVSSLREVGLKAYLGHFFMGSIKNPLYLFIGLIEMVTDLVRVISLSLRLFLNVAIVEAIVVVFAYLGHIIAPVTATPFYFLDIFDDILQAFIFALLGVMYLATAVNHVDEHRRAESLTENAPSGKMGTSLDGAGG
ncbi:MAG TPA: F0F1 ATP synthase subunit A [Candidatus Saccharimonadales bacterium]|nr:F0F1 ATP synthase subunit A [Candidatus Saccharimonadales bacterium]